MNSYHVSEIYISLTWDVFQEEEFLNCKIKFTWKDKVEYAQKLLHIANRVHDDTSNFIKDIQDSAQQRIKGLGYLQCITITNVYSSNYHYSHYSRNDHLDLIEDTQTLKSAQLERSQVFIGLAFDMKDWEDDIDSFLIEAGKHGKNHYPSYRLF
jgi:hypothetical protein